VKGQVGGADNHPLSRYQGELWISLSSAIAMYEDPEGAIIVYPEIGGLVVDESPSKLAHRAKLGLINPPNR